MDRAGASECGQRTGRGQGSCSPHTAASRQDWRCSPPPESSADLDPVVWKLDFWLVPGCVCVGLWLCCEFSNLLVIFSWGLKEELRVGTRLSSRPMISWVMSSLQVRPARPQRRQTPPWLNPLPRGRFWGKNSPCTIRSLRISWSLCRVCTDTWYWTGCWWAVWHCPNRPSVHDDNSHTKFNYGAQGTLKWSWNGLKLWFLL